MKKLVSWLVVSMFIVACGVPAPVDVAQVESALAGPMPYRGVNLAGAEFGVASDGTGGNPGTFGTTYTYPDPAYASGYTSADYFLAKGMTTFRLPFRWERLQPTRGAAFDAAELTRLRTTVNRLTARGAVVLLDPHNYARYGTALIGSATVSNAQFADFWSRLANEFKTNPNVLFGLMNEPYDLPTEQWVSAANAAIAAIRATGATNLVLVPGNAWTGAHSWFQNWYGTANSVALLNVVDPGNNMAIEVHQYFDSNFSGAASTCVSGAGAAQLSAFTQWLRANNKRGFLGEFATGDGATCLGVLENALAHLDANTDVWLGWTYWAAGPWWGNAWTSLEPSGGADTAQMNVLENHLAVVSAPTCTDGVRNGTETGIDCGGTCAACAPSCTDGVRNGTETGIDCGGTCAACAPSCTDGVRNGTETGIDCGGTCAACAAPATCQATTWEAEYAYHTAGRAVSSGWNLYSNGYLELSGAASLAAGATLVVTARGSLAGGVGPRMTLSVGGVSLGTVSVAATAWTTYTFPVPASLGGAVRVTFDNDAIINGEDRNLFVDNVASQCPRLCSPTTYQAETMTRSTGGAVPGGWNLWSNGYASTPHSFTAGAASLTVTARGSSAGGVWPVMRVSVGGVLVGTVTVSSTSWQTYSVPFTAPGGQAELRLAFDNDAIIGSEDRNLFLDQVVVGCP